MPRHAGFTLIELVVALLVLGIALGVAAPSFMGLLERGRAQGVFHGLTASLAGARLAALTGRGVAIPPNIWTARVTPAVAAAAFEATGAEQLVVKPTVSGGAWRTVRVAVGDLLEEALREAPEGGAMIQPYLPTIETAGETSLLFFGGRLSHVVNKRPGRQGEFRIQTQFGGQYRALDAAPEEALALAERTLAAIDEPLLYARIDMAPDPDGVWRLMEAELIEPDFYLGAAPRGGANFAQAVREWLEQ